MGRPDDHFRDDDEERECSRPDVITQPSEDRQTFVTTSKPISCTELLLRLPTLHRPLVGRLTCREQGDVVRTDMLWMHGQ